MRGLIFIILFLLASCQTDDYMGTIAKVGNEACIEYELKNSSGYRFDGTNQPTGPTPLCFYVGKKEVIPSIDEAVVGMSIGESKSLKITENQGFGTTGLYYKTHYGDTVWLSEPSDTLFLWVKMVGVNPLPPS